MTWREVAFRLLVALSVPLMVGSVLAHHWPWRWTSEVFHGVMGMALLALGWPVVTSIELVGHVGRMIEPVIHFAVIDGVQTVTSRPPDPPGWWNLVLSDKGRELLDLVRRHKAALTAREQG